MTRDQLMKLSVLVQKDWKWFINTVLNTRLYPKTREIIDAAQNNDQVAITSCYSSGKCLSKLLRIMLADGSFEIAENLIGKTFEMLSYENGHQIIKKAYAVDNGKQKCYKITYKNGMTQTRTYNHPLYAGRKTGKQNRIAYLGKGGYIEELGFVDAENLKVGDVIASPIKLNIEGKETVSPEEARLMGYLIGDGCLVGTSARFSQNLGHVLDDFKQCCDVLGFTVNNTRKFEYLLSTGIRPWLLKHEMNNQSSWTKSVPIAIQIGTEEIIRHFLSALYACDGWAYSKQSDSKKFPNAAEIGYCTVSRELAEDIYYLLKRLGIRSTVRSKKTSHVHKGIKKYNTCWIVEVTGKRSIEDFCREITIIGKEEAQQECLRVASCMSDRVQQKWRYWDIPEGFEWEEIAAIEEVYEDTVAIEVEDTHTFLTPFSYEHNSYILSRIALAFLFAHPFESTVLTTSTGGRQVRQQLWRYIHEAVEHAQLPLGGKLLQTEYRLADGWWAQGFTARRGETVPLHGYHNKYMMVIFDEASGIEPATWYALDNMMAGGQVKVIASGNPTSVDTPFYQCFTKDARLWKRIYISAFDTPNVQAKRDDVIPGLTSWSWVKRMREQYTPDDPIYQIKVLGQFPNQSEYSLIQPLWVEWARDEPPKFDPTAPIVAGLDVAYTGGDETVLAVRVDNKLIKIVGVRDNDPLQAKKLVESELSGVRTAGRLKMINVDATTGGIVISKLLEDDGWPVTRIISAARPTTREDRYENMRAQLWFNLRDIFRERRINGEGIITDEIMNQLAAVRYEVNHAGKQQVEDKKDYKKRMGYSPDYADAILYCFADAVGSGIVPVNLPGFGDAFVPPQISTSRPGLVVVKNQHMLFDEDGEALGYSSEYGDHYDQMEDAWLDENDDILETPKVRMSGALRFRR